MFRCPCLVLPTDDDVDGLVLPTADDVDDDVIKNVITGQSTPHTTTVRPLTLCLHPKPVPGDSQTICDGTKIVWAPVGHVQSKTEYGTVSEGLPDQLGTCSRLQDSLRRCQNHMGTCRRHPDCLRLCKRVLRTGVAPAGDSQTVSDGDSLQDRRRTCRTLPDSLQWCQDRLGTCRRIPDCAPKSPRGTCKRLSDSLRRCQDRLGTCRRLPNGFRWSPRPYPDGLGTVADFLGVYCWCSAGLEDCLAPSNTVWKSPSGVQTVLALSQTVWESPVGVSETVWHRRRLYGSFLHMPRRSWCRRRLFGISCRCFTGLGDCLALSQTVWESPVGVNAVLAPSQTVCESPAGTLNATNAVLNSSVTNGPCFPSSSDHHSRLTTPSCDHCNGNLLLVQDKWSVGGRLASVNHTVNRLQSGFEVVEKCHLSGDYFSCYLHQNYTDFFSSVDDIVLASEYLSDSDFLTMDWASRSALQQYAASVATRGIIFCNSGRARHTDPGGGLGWKPLHKPQWYTTSKQAKQNCETARYLFRSYRSSPVVLQTELIPYISLINTTLHDTGQIAFMQEICRFSNQRKYEKLDEKDVDISDDDDTSDVTKSATNQIQGPSMLPTETDDVISSSQSNVKSSQAEEEEDFVIEDYDDD
ncbi:hypothetical protein DPMN_083427 [Dreissena polymorpha]|uniref:Uncharacterized protein n=1 Tax=Dreissena polymorpha TaxID=45954 RepID=A0A9D3Y8R5_DREPO|nr:hypothetical protein DPMN_083427 [Dreissena polymorpha]